MSGQTTSGKSSSNLDASHVTPEDIAFSTVFGNSPEYFSQAEQEVGGECFMNFQVYTVKPSQSTLIEKTTDKLYHARRQMGASIVAVTN